MVLLAPSIVLASPNTQVVVVHLQFPTPELIDAGNGVYPRIGGSVEWRGGPGLPPLPMLPYSILLPPGSRVLEVTYESRDRVLATGVSLAHMAEPVPCGYTAAAVAPRDPEDRYPEETVMHDGVRLLRGFSILPVSVVPVTYMPDGGILIFHASVDIRIEVKPGSPGPNYRGLPRDFERVSKIVVNPELLELYPSSRQRTQYDYVIITSSGMEDEFQQLADYREGLGYSSYVVTVEWIQDNFDGQDLQEKIRNFIIYAYQNWGIEYVLLGGDDEVIPHRGLYVSTGSYTDTDIAADLYYAALDGTWNDDGDSYWGEVDEMDPYAEVFVGRAPVASPSEAHAFVNKTIWYETVRGGVEYLNTSLMVGQQLDSYPTWGGDYKDEVAEYVPDNWTVDKLYDRDWAGHDWPKEELIQRLEDGRHLVNNMGHGNVYTVAKLSRSDVMSLENDELFIFYSQACYAGSFDNRYPGGSYDPEDSIGEKMVQNPDGGAVAFIGNSRYGWYSPGSTNGPSQAFDLKFFHVLFDEWERILGAAQQLSKEELAGSISSNSYLRWCYYELNLIGDPLLWFGGMPEPIIITSPKEGDHVGGEVEVSGLASLPDGTPPDAVYVRVDEGAWISAEPGNPWSATVDTSAYPDGEHTIWAKAVYGLNVYYDNVTVVFDNTPPTITGFEVEGGRYHNTSGVTVHITASDELSGISGMRFILDGVPLTDWLDFSEDFTISVTHEEGDHHLSVELMDEVGNVATSDPVLLTFDFTPPWIRITNPQDGGGVNTDDVEVTWEMGDEYSPIVDVWLSLDGGDWIEVGVHDSYVVHVGPDGNHTVSVRVEDAAGNAGTATSRFLKDSHPPHLRVTFPEEGSWIGPGSLRLTWESEDTDIVKYEVSIDSGEWIPVGLSTSYSLRELSEGPHSATVRARDIGGNYGYDFVNFTIDKSPPSLTILEPEDGAIFNATPIVVMWEGEDEYSGIDHYEVSLDGSEPEDIGMNTSYVLSPGEGEHTVTVIAYDRAGLSSVSSRTFFLDFSPPVIVRISPTEGSIISESEVTLSIECQDNVTEVTIFYSVDGGDWIAYSGPTVLQLGDGRHEVLVSAVDGAGHRAQASTWFYVDTSPPEVRILSPEDGSILNVTTLQVEWEASDSVTWVMNSTLLVDGTPVSCSSPCHVDLSDGEHELTVVAEDAAGNRASARATVLVDTVPPSVEIRGVEDGSFVGSSTIVLQISVVEEGEYEAWYRVDGSDWSPVEGGRIELFLGEGVHTVEVRAEDWAGNIGYSTLSFTVDLTPPTVSIGSPSKGAYYSTSVVSLRLSAEDNYGIESIEYSLDGGRWREYAGQTFLSGLVDGEHLLNVRVVDVAGHETVSSASFHVDTVPPIVDIVYPAPNAMVSGSFQVRVRVLEDNLSNVTLYLDGVLAVVGPTWIPEQNITFQVSADDGRHTVAVVANDKAGNSDMDTVTVNVDSTPPYVRIVSPADGSLLSSEFVTVEFEAGDSGSGLSYVEVSVDGGSPERLGGPGKVNLGPLGDGEHQVSVVAYDRVGNRATAVLSFRIDTVPPHLTAEVQPPSARVGDTVTVVASVDEEATLYVSVDGGPWQQFSGNSYQLSTEGMSTGTHTVTVRAVDAAGNVAMLQLSFEVSPRIKISYVMGIAIFLVLVVVVAALALRRH